MKERYSSTTDLDHKDIALLLDGWITLSGVVGRGDGVSACVGDSVHLDNVDACLGRSLGLVIWIRGGCVLRTRLKGYGE